MMRGFVLAGFAAFACTGEATAFAMGHEPGGSAAASSESASTLPPPSPELLAPRPRAAAQPSMHPPVVLRDAQGAAVAESGSVVSARKTCDGCHDASWIIAHDQHSTVSASVAAIEPGRASFAAGMAASGNCFLCHVRAADDGARREALASGRADEAEVATLAKTGLVVRDGDRWVWQRDRFRDDGAVSASLLGLGRPDSRACGFCHGIVDSDPAPLSLTRDARNRMTELTGVVFSGQRMSDSAENLAGKDQLTGPWDLHAERMVSCASCHFSPNHPAYAFPNRGPEHLQFDARRLAITDYLRRPDHRLARGGHGDGHGGNLRRCESCHDAGKVHGFLPRAERHFAAMLCETCHVPVAHAGARESVDSTMLDATGEPRIVYRGVRDDGYLTGFRPLLLPRVEAGKHKLGPNNLVTTVAWVESKEGKQRPVAHDTLLRAFLVNGAHRPELLRALDADHDGKLAPSELLLDTAAKVEVARGLLVAAGVSSPEIAAEARAYPIHHGVSPGRFATRDCDSCHAANSRIGETFVVASSLPFGVTPRLPDGLGTLARDEAGRLVLRPTSQGIHVFGHTRSGVLDGIGLLLFAGAIAGAGGHALLRIRAARRRSKERS